MHTLKSRLILASFVLLAVAAPALHASTFLFTIATSNAPGADPATVFAATGSLSGPADPANPNAFDINTITGTANGFTILSVVQPGIGSIGNPITADGFTFNNVLYIAPGVPHVDPLGFLIQIQSPIGISLAHVYSLPGGGYETDVVDPHEPGAVTPFNIVTFSISAPPDTGIVPEPAALAMVGTGLVGLTGLIRRRFTR